ncbi:hypothetical protein EVB81_035 [Rhizobium phage RHph_I46]|uniref:Uncharacterized protein n=1 Tax=Rhizobium phage RHph_I1_9 TaxID=2509729 RepID=A0A7S5RDH9_9CAUD|nr:hypothetical protein PP936_gp034 [Rhizobium phage RHph_I1_9]QIG69604.1 hypothetical protein EVB81_035 [Rhizobium phage RHph_I46]QIG70885.1 hypothetical protein EVB92_035 [Rhizobium phage RHph_I9]QIG73471.1 hypothetical protein EVC04_034 [Rhizobium phage RHph_I1_9]QIG76224.1 hypothetical protein EVC25_035 [Rhizobium phage RHph_I34]
MTPKFKAGDKVRFNDFIIKECPKYAGLVYEIVCIAHSAWEIGGNNEWYGEYNIRLVGGTQISGTYENSLVAA